MPVQALFVSLLALVMAFLPKSPFNMVLNSVSSIPYLANLNWFFPVTECVAVTEVWVTAVGIYYLYSAILRWIKVVS